MVTSTSTAASEGPGLHNVVLATKLFIPPLRPGLIHRPRLMEQLDRALAAPLILVSAPAGFGKTTVVCEWLALHGTAPSEDGAVPADGRRRPLVTAWVSLDPSDNDPLRFLAYVVAALGRAVPGSCTTASSWLQSPQPPPVDAILTVLLNDLCSLAHPLVLVLDDYHVIDNEAVQRALAYFVQRSPPSLHVVINTRADPPLPLARWRASGLLAEIRSDDLRFSESEVGRFLAETMALHLGRDEVSLLASRTEGWIVGLQMAALSMQGRSPASVARFLASFGGDDRFILDYLVEEVLDRQVEPVREFLLETAILERMTPSLCDAVRGQSDSALMLDWLERGNLFIVPLDNRREWRRYHHLFADLVAARLRQSEPSLVPILHDRASRWFEEHGLLPEAMHHALVSANPEHLVSLIERNALALLDYGELPLLGRWLDAVDEKVVQTRPWLCVALGWVRVYTGHLDGLEAVLGWAEAAIGETPLAEQRSIRGHAAAIRSYLFSQQGDKAASAEQARTALALLPEDDRMTRGLAAGRLAHALRWLGDFEGSEQALVQAIAISRASGHGHVEVDVTCDLGGLRIAQGRLHDAADIFKDVLQRAEDAAPPGAPRPPMLATACINLGWVLREWNQLIEASRYDLEGLRLAEQWGQKDVLRSAYYEMIRLYRATGDLEAGREMVQRVCELTREMSPWFYAIARAEAAVFQVRQGDFELADQWARDTAIAACDATDFRYLSQYLALARVLAGRRAWTEADRVLASCQQLAAAAGANGHLIEILLLQALLLSAQDRRSESLEALTSALTLARPEGFVRTFVDEGPAARALITAFAMERRARGSRGAADPLLDYANALLDCFPGDQPANRPAAGPQAARHLGGPSASLVEPLTPRELEVLQLMDEGLSNAEIASKLVLAEGTVKTHTHSIFGKLGVSTRTQALHRARSLALLVS